MERGLADGGQREQRSHLESTPRLARDHSRIHDTLINPVYPLAQIWDLKTYKLKNDLPGHTDEVYCVDFVADKVVSGGRDRAVKM